MKTLCTKIIKASSCILLSAVFSGFTPAAEPSSTSDQSVAAPSEDIFRIFGVTLGKTDKSTFEKEAVEAPLGSMPEPEYNDKDILVAIRTPIKGFATEDYKKKFDSVFGEAVVTHPKQDSAGVFTLIFASTQWQTLQEEYPQEKQKELEAFLNFRKFNPNDEDKDTTEFRLTKYSWKSPIITASLSESRMCGIGTDICIQAAAELNIELNSSLKQKEEAKKNPKELLRAEQRKQKKAIESIF